MKFEEIPSSIMAASNSYEKNRGIETLNVECLSKKENCALFVAKKSDNSRTLFYARKNKRASDHGWHWFCPSDYEAETFMPLVRTIYQLVDVENKKQRWNEA